MAVARKLLQHQATASQADAPAQGICSNKRSISKENLCLYSQLQELLLLTKSYSQYVHTEYATAHYASCDSPPATTSTFWSLYRSYSASMVNWKAVGFSINVVTSQNRIPGFGKSGIPLMESLMIFCLSSGVTAGLAPVGATTVAISACWPAAVLVRSKTAVAAEQCTETGPLYDSLD